MKEIPSNSQDTKTPAPRWAVLIKTLKLSLGKEPDPF